MEKKATGFNKKIMINTMANIFLIEGIAMLPSFALAVYDRDSGDIRGMGASMIILLVLAVLGKLLSRGHATKIKVRDSYLMVLLAWVAAVGGGMLPYLIATNGMGFVDSLFESAAAWTTTNAWVVDINLLPRSIVLWRATSSWLGGMGIIVLTIILFSALGVNAQKLAGLEVTGPELEKHTAKMADTAKLLYVLYFVASLVEMLLFRAGGVPKFDSIINAMSTISTSGTIDYHGVLSRHFTPFVKIVVIIFSILASINFAIYIKIIKKRTKEAFMDLELHIFALIIVLSTVLVGVILFAKGTYTNIGDAVLNAATGVVSFSCTTGFQVEHVEAWPTACKFIFLMLTIVGGCSTSTAGGIKVVRFAVILQLIKRGVYKRIHPRAVKPVVVRDMVVSTSNASSISTFMLLFLGIYLMSVLILSLENLDMETTLTAPLALFTNCGLGFGSVSDGNFEVFSHFGRLYSAFLMVLGRLEMYALLILFSRSFWRPNR